jgi:hypothetical protein
MKTNTCNQLNSRCLQLVQLVRQSARTVPQFEQDQIIFVISFPLTVD